MEAKIKVMLVITKDQMDIPGAVAAINKSRAKVVRTEQKTETK